MDAHRNQSGTMIQAIVAAPQNNVMIGQDVIVMVIVVVLMILGLLLTGRSGGG